MEIFEYIVDSEAEGMRIDRYLKKKFKNEPLSKIFQALRKGDVKVEGKKVKENYKLSLNEKISVKYLKAENSSDENRNCRKTNSKRRRHHKGSSSGSFRAAFHRARGFL